MTLAAILLYRPAMLPGHDLAWKTIATLPFVVAVAASLLPGASVFTRLRGPLSWTN
jgi:hypothetical protein